MQENSPEGEISLVASRLCKHWKGVPSEIRGADCWYKRRYLGAHNDLLDFYSETVAQLTDAYRGAARGAFRRAKALAPCSITRQDLLNEALFVTTCVCRVSAQIPTQQQSYVPFDRKEEFPYIPLPSLLAEDAAERDRIKAERESARQREHRERADRWRTLTTPAPCGCTVRPPTPVCMRRTRGDRCRQRLAGAGRPQRPLDHLLKLHTNSIVWVTRLLSRDRGWTGSNDLLPFISKDNVPHDSKCGILF